MSFEREVLCQDCHGEGGTTETCSDCQGSGQVRERVQTVFGVMEQTHACATCSGRGKVVIEACSACDGEGKKREKVEKTIEIPQGIEDGMSIKMREE